MTIFNTPKKETVVPPLAPVAAAIPNAGMIIPGLVVKGEILGKGDLKVEGTVEGKINLEGLVSIGSKGEVKGEIESTNVTVAGKIEGNIRAKEKADIQPTGQVTGDISAARIMVSEGAQINGSVKVNKQAGKLPG